MVVPFDARRAASPATVSKPPLGTYLAAQPATTVVRLGARPAALSAAASKPSFGTHLAAQPVTMVVPSDARRAASPATVSMPPLGTYFAAQPATTVVPLGARPAALSAAASKPPLDAHLAAQPATIVVPMGTRRASLPATAPLLPLRSDTAAARPVSASGSAPVAASPPGPSATTFVSRTLSAAHIPELAGALSGGVTVVCPSSPSTAALDCLRSFFSPAVALSMLADRSCTQVARAVRALLDGTRPALAPSPDRLCVAEVSAAALLSNPQLQRRGAPLPPEGLSAMLQALQVGEAATSLTALRGSLAASTTAATSQVVAVEQRLHALDVYSASARYKGAGDLPDSGSSFLHHQKRAASSAVFREGPMRASSAPPRPRPNANRPQDMYRDGPWFTAEDLAPGRLAVFPPHPPLLLQTHLPAARDWVASLQQAPPATLPVPAVAAATAAPLGPLDLPASAALASIFDCPETLRQHRAAGCPRCALGDCLIPALLQHLHAAAPALYKEDKMRLRLQK
jgi:hypothetical protein